MKRYSYYVLTFVAGLAIASAFFILNDQSATPGSTSTEVHEGQYHLINPLLFCDSGERISETPSSTLIKNNVQNAITAIQTKNPDIKISVYYRNLNNGPWFGIKENVKFIPSSLLKVQVLLTALNEVEDNPDFLKKEIQYEGTDVVTEQYFKPSQNLEIHKKYSVQDLLEHMIRYSDNNAALAVAQLLGKDKIAQTYRDVGVDTPTQDSEDFMSVKAYSSFFRILYNSSYLRRDLSEAALNLLSETDFTNALVAGVPSKITVAHKFGERLSGDKKLQQLHDCGIVYHPTQPYILCVMTSGSDFETLSQTIKSISEEAWKGVEASK